jgi:threonine aldolase
VGSVLVSSSPFIKKARRFRKIFGGGMRQGGFLAAAGLYALENNIARLEEDHLNAKAVSEALSYQQWIDEILTVETNILIFSVKGKYTAPSIVHALESSGVKTIAISPTQVRMVFHLDVTKEMTDQLIYIIRHKL